MHVAVTECRYIDSVSEQILEWNYDYNGATAFFTKALISCVCMRTVKLTRFFFQFRSSPVLACAPQSRQSGFTINRVRKDRFQSHKRVSSAWHQCGGRWV